MTAALLTAIADLTPGTWYCIGFEALESSEIDWGGSRICRFEGTEERHTLNADGSIAETRNVPIWTDDDGELIESFFDPALGVHVATDAADAYLPA